MVGYEMHGSESFPKCIHKIVQLTTAVWLVWPLINLCTHYYFVIVILKLQCSAALVAAFEWPEWQWDWPTCMRNRYVTKTH